MGQKIVKGPKKIKKSATEKTRELEILWKFLDFVFITNILSWKCLWKCFWKWDVDDFFLWFSTFLDLYSSLCLLKSVETTLVSVTRLLWRWDDHRQIHFGRQDYDSLLGALLCMAWRLGGLAFPKCTFFSDFNSLFHSLKYWNVIEGNSGFRDAVFRENEASENPDFDWCYDL